MPTEKSLEETMVIIQENQKLIEERNEKSQQALWDFWHEKKLWSYKEAVMLSVCGAYRCIETCAVHMGDCHCECCTCFNGMYVDKHNAIRNILSLYHSEDWTECGFDNGKVPDRISLFTFVTWAKTKKSITLSQELLDIYAQETDIISLGLPPFEMKMRVSSDSQHEEQVIHTRAENAIACRWADALRKNGKSEAEIAQWLLVADNKNRPADKDKNNLTVIACILRPDAASPTHARDQIENILKKA